MGAEIRTLEELEKFSNSMTYREKIETKNIFDIPGILKKTFSDSPYEKITGEIYLEKSEEILEQLEDTGEEYGRDISRRIMGHTSPLEENHQISYKKAEKLLEEGDDGFSINYTDQEQTVKIQTWKNPTVDGYDEILAEIDIDPEKVDAEEFLEYKNALEKTGFR